MRCDHTVIVKRIVCGFFFMSYFLPSLSVRVPPRWVKIHFISNCFELLDLVNKLSFSEEESATTVIRDGQFFMKYFWTYVAIQVLQRISRYFMGRPIMHTLYMISRESFSLSFIDKSTCGVSFSAVQLIFRKLWLSVPQLVNGDTANYHASIPFLVCFCWVGDSLFSFYTASCGCSKNLHYPAYCQNIQVVALCQPVSNYCRILISPFIPVSDFNWGTSTLVAFNFTMHKAPKLTKLLLKHNIVLPYMVWNGRKMFLWSLTHLKLLLVSHLMQAR